MSTPTKVDQPTHKPMSVRAAISMLLKTRRRFKVQRTGLRFLLGTAEWIEFASPTEIRHAAVMLGQISLEQREAAEANRRLIEATEKLIAKSEAVVRSGHPLPEGSTPVPVLRRQLARLNKEEMLNQATDTLTSYIMGMVGAALPVRGQA